LTELEEDQVVWDTLVERGNATGLPFTIRRSRRKKGLILLVSVQPAEGSTTPDKASSTNESIGEELGKLHF